MVSIKSRASGTLGKCSTTELHPQPFVNLPFMEHVFVVKSKLYLPPDLKDFLLFFFFLEVLHFTYMPMLHFEVSFG
jgi:hypothetical protein